MDRDFIKRSIRASAIVTVILAPFTFYYFGISTGWGFAAGAVWNIVNVYLLSQVVTNLITPHPSNKKLGAIAGVLKFPVLYGIGYVILSYTNPSVYGIMAGFTLILAIFLLKAIGIYYLDASYQGKKSYGSS
ncbi:MAG: hypothetical protein A2132_05140 [Nitrospirae bacterium RBG_16_43_11]|nr:MAG: hypothetical protein A2132_05140 [Nitrospirae bacterium RBG_16_43_11]